MIVLALDIALRNTGWSIFENDLLLSWGLLSIPRSASGYVTADRGKDAAILASYLAPMLDGVDRVVAEFPTGGRSAVAVMSMFISIGVVIGLTKKVGVPLIAILPREAKRRVLGNSCATKGEVMEWARREYPGELFFAAKNKFEHIADSLLIHHASRVDLRSGGFVL